MITRPLDLASRMRPEPRNFDWLFFVNIVVLVFFFSLFGSRFVLAPGLSVQLPTALGGNANARPTTHFITVLASGQVITPHGRLQIIDRDGGLKMDQLEIWLRDQARASREPVLLVRGDEGVPMSIMSAISGVAKHVGFLDVTWALVDPGEGGSSRGR